MTNRKYAMIKINERGWMNGDSSWEEETDRDICELVEVHSDDNGYYISFSRPFLSSVKALEMAYNDVKEDGVNTYFWKNGEFLWDDTCGFWDWTINSND